MPLLVLTPRYTDDSRALWAAAGRLGWRVHRLEGWRVADELRQERDIVLYLEALFGPDVASQLGLRLEEPPIDWLPRLPAEYRLRSVELTTLGQARCLTETRFIKPPNDKSFAARPCVGADLPTEYPDDMPVLVAEVVAWEKEFRSFILDRQVRAISVYSRLGELQRDHDFAQTPDEVDAASNFVQRVLNDERVVLPRAAVLDVGVITGRGWAVVEQNAAWGSGIYGCDPEEVLVVLQHATTPR